LHEASFGIAKGQIAALVGPSGSGKTTITSLLMRFYDLSACMVRIDGVDIRDYSIPSLRRELAMVAQDVTLLK
jgi:subfamily B ATP-binding cassette protein MsbA